MITRFNNVEDEQQNGLADLRDPFNASSCYSIWFWIRKDYDNRIRFTAKVEFRNGPTKGEQQFEATDFKALVAKVEAFTTSLPS